MKLNNSRKVLLLITLLSLSFQIYNCEKNRNLMSVTFLTEEKSEKVEAEEIPTSSELVNLATLNKEKNKEDSNLNNLTSDEASNNPSPIKKISEISKEISKETSEISKSNVAEKKIEKIESEEDKQKAEINKRLNSYRIFEEKVNNFLKNHQEKIKQIHKTSSEKVEIQREEVKKIHKK